MTCYSWHPPITEGLRRQGGYDTMRLNRRAIAAIVFAFSLCVFSLCRARLVSLDADGPAQTRYLTGDEPAYMMLTHSLVTDGDFNLYNNRVNKDGRFFGKEKCDAHGARKDWENKEIYSIHTPGLAILLAPAYAAGLRGPLAPRVTVCLFFNFLAALLAANAFLFCAGMSGLDSTGRLAAGKLLPALAGTAVIIFTAPVIFYSNTVYPELPAALFILYALRQALTREAPGRAGYALAAVAIGFLPWLSFRFLLPALFMLWMLWDRRTRLSGSRWFGDISLAVPLFVSILLFLFYQHRAFGTINPGAGYDYQKFAHIRLQGKVILDGILGVIVDRGHGILTWSPVYILSLTGILLLLRERAGAGLRILFLLLLIYLPGATFVFWWGGFSPPPRYLMVPAPILGGLLCYALSRNPRKSFVILFIFLLSASLYFGYLGCRYPSYLYRHKHIVTNHYPRFMIAVFPSLFLKRASTWPLAAAWLSVIVLVNGYYLITWKRKEKCVSA